MRLRRERPEDWWEVEALYDLCFAPGRTTLSSYRLRDGVDPVPELCLVARDPSGVLVGAIRNWPVHVGRAPTLLLGPVAVHPTHQGEGLGAGLIREATARARPDWSRVLLVGDLPYYARFGFARLPGVRMPPPTNPDRVLGLALVPHAWDGVGGDVVRWEGPLPAGAGAPSESP
jgi:predicted N-acetyltransferase YhbS